MVKQFFAVAAVLAGDYTDRFESFYSAGYHITQIANGCGDYIQRTGLI
jgi:hypothetical protein